ncbi:MAG: type II CAAX endopeptidase family protein [Anaerolineae bacterium]|nr:CPBP family intramembrane metalloprotease [Anaerolineae bacterium]MDW8101490.1 type II CAAX endopeptidase family protein [Anaerolineae bacterium]
MSWQRFLLKDGRLHPGWRAFLFLPLYIITQTATGAAFILAFYLPTRRIPEIRPPSVFLIGLELVITGALVVLVFVMRRFVDGKSFRSLGFEVGRRLLPDAGLGLALGFFLMALVFALHVSLGWAAVGQILPLSQALQVLVLSFFFLLTAALNEELAFRGYFLQNLEEAFGTAWAVAVSSIIFSLFHFLNPHFSRLAFINIALAGVLFAVAYLLTRNLWLPTVLHFSWNYFQGPVFGFPVSGIAFPSILNLEIRSGNFILSGGAFGPEGGLSGTIATLLGIAILWLWMGRNAPKR